MDLVNTVFESVPLGGHFTHSPSQAKAGREGGKERSSDRRQRGRRGMRYGGGGGGSFGGGF